MRAWNAGVSSPIVLLLSCQVFLLGHWVSFLCTRSDVLAKGNSLLADIHDNINLSPTTNTIKVHCSDEGRSMVTETSAFLKCLLLDLC